MIKVSELINKLYFLSQPIAFQLVKIIFKN